MLHIWLSLRKRQAQQTNSSSGVKNHILHCFVPYYSVKTILPQICNLIYAWKLADEQSAATKIDEEYAEKRQTLYSIDLRIILCYITESNNLDIIFSGGKSRLKHNYRIIKNPFWTAQKFDFWNLVLPNCGKASASPTHTKLPINYFINNYVCSV